MVRVISEKLFSPPRSRHSSGETVDKELAARAVKALSSLNSATSSTITTTNATSSSSSFSSSASSRPRAVSELSSDYESSSDSHWDSEVDGVEDREGTVLQEGSNRDGEESLCCSGGVDVLQKRKERRRERNKLSAQAYRIRRREQCVKQQTVLRDLQEKNSLLKDEVLSLEEQIDQLRRSAVPNPPPPPLPPPHSPTTSRDTTPTPDSPTTILPPPPPPLPSATALDRPHQGAQPRPGMRSCRWEGVSRSLGPHGFVADNDPTTCSQQLLSSPHHPPPLSPPVVDNFSFSPQPSPRSPSSTVASPSAASSYSFPGGFSLFPVQPPSSGVCHGRHLTPGGVYPQAPFIPPATNMLGEEGGVLEDPVHHHPHPHPFFQIPRRPPLHFPSPPPPPGQHIDLNANAEEGPGSNLNNNFNNKNTATTATSPAPFWGSFHKSDNMNNNTDSVVSATSGFGGARPKTTQAVGALNLVMKSSQVFK